MAKVLVVDDEPANRLLLVTLLKHAGHEPLEAENGVEALRLASEAKPALIIVDLNLPGMSGAEFMKALRADPVVGATEVALYSGTMMSAPLMDFMQLAGIRHVIPKPGEPEEILRVLNTVLA